MGVLDSVLKVFVGDKTKKDLKAITPIVDQIKSFESQFEALSIDELRQNTSRFKTTIKEATADLQSQIDALEEKAENEPDIDVKENFYGEIDDLKVEIYKTTEEVLNDILPEAFATVKETAKRFFHNTSLEVSATEFDRTLSASKDYVNLNGDKAIWNNSWDAAGKPITWDMIHYDVQLIGGIAMHQGIIAEMQTGEGKTLVATLPMYLNALSTSVRSLPKFYLPPFAFQQLSLGA